MTATVTKDDRKLHRTYSTTTTQSNLNGPTATKTGKQILKVGWYEEQTGK